MHWNNKPFYNSIFVSFCLCFTNKPFLMSSFTNVQIMMHFFYYYVIIQAFCYINALHGCFLFFVALSSFSLPMGHCFGSINLHNFFRAICHVIHMMWIAIVSKFVENIHKRQLDSLDLLWSLSFKAAAKTIRSVWLTCNYWERNRRNELNFMYFSSVSPLVWYQQIKRAYKLYTKYACVSNCEWDGWTEQMEIS